MMLNGMGFLGRLPVVTSALDAAADQVESVADALRLYADTQGIGGNFRRADVRLAKLGANDVERTLLGYADVRGYVLARAIITKKANTDDVASLAAAAVGLLSVFETTKLKSTLKLSSEPGNPWETFFAELVDQVVETENLSTLVDLGGSAPADVRADIIADLKANPPTLIGSDSIERVKRYLTLARSPAQAALLSWVGKGEIRRDLLDKAGVQAAMLDYVEGLGVDFSGFSGGPASTKYDEYFALAYEHASRHIALADDPIQSKYTGSMNDWDFQVDPLDGLEQQQVVARNIRAAGALDYVFVLGERLGIFHLADALVLRWAKGSLDIPDGDGADRLYRYWKLLDERSSPEERGLLYRRVLAKGSTKVLPGTVINDEFPMLWGNLMQEIVDYVDKAETTRHEDRGPSRVRIARSTRQLQYNTSAHATGIAPIQTAEIYAQLQDALDLLAHPQMISIFAGGQRQNVWTVIERLHRDEFGSAINVEALRSVAVDGNRVFQWIADYVTGNEHTASFDDFIDAGQSFILAEASTADADATLNGGRAAHIDGQFEDEFDDEFDEEFDDEFAGY